MKSYSFSIFEPVRSTRRWDYTIKAKSKQEAEKIVQRILESEDFCCEPYFYNTEIVDEEFPDNESEYKIEFNG